MFSIRRWTQAVPDSARGCALPPTRRRPTPPRRRLLLMRISICSPASSTPTSLGVHPCSQSLRRLPGAPLRIGRRLHVPLATPPPCARRRRVLRPAAAQSCYRRNASCPACRPCRRSEEEQTTSFALYSTQSRGTHVAVHAASLMRSCRTCSMCHAILARGERCCTQSAGSYQAQAAPSPPPTHLISGCDADGCHCSASDCGSSVWRGQATSAAISAAWAPGVCRGWNCTSRQLGSSEADGTMRESGQRARGRGYTEAQSVSSQSRPIAFATTLLLPSLFGHAVLPSGQAAKHV